MPSFSQFANRSLAAWIEDLKKPQVDDRYRALLAVCSLGSPDAVVLWTRHALMDEDSGVRALAAKTLGEVLRDRGASISEDVRTETISELTSHLQDSDPDVAFEAARALGRIDPGHLESRRILLSLLDDEGTQPLTLAIIVSAMAERNDEDVEPLIPLYRKLIAHPQAEVRENVSAALAKWGSRIEPLVSELILSLQDDEPIVRENAAIALGQMSRSNPDVLCALEAAKADEDEGVAQAAREARDSFK